jgi:hypothetical protein
MSFELTICSVSYKHSRHILENIALTKTLLPNTKLEWLMANNAPEYDSFDGVVKYRNGCNIQIFAGPPNNFEGPGKGSKHHAAGLELVVSHAKTRFVLILDPDFYLIMPNWAERIIEYMTRNNIALFGVPWHPKWSGKWQYFPCAHCLLVDTEYIDLSSVSFMPDSKNAQPLNIWKRFLSKIPLVGSRAYIGCSKDTGCQIYKSYSASPQTRCALATPSLSRVDLHDRYDKYNTTLVDLWFLFNRALDKLFPESMSLFPKRKDYFTETCFSDVGLPDCKRFGWEEFFWNKEPFGFHIRGFPKKPAERHMEIERICNALEMFKNSAKSVEG